MKILFCALHFGYFRNFESAICALADRGHRVHLAAEEPERFGGHELVERIAEAYPAVTWGWMPDRRREPWAALAVKVRHALEYVRFLDPLYDLRPKLRERAREQAPQSLARLLGLRAARTRAARAVLRNGLKCAHRLGPRSPVAESFIRDQQPDVLLLASLTYARSQQADYLRAAQTLGVRTAACIMGFDHLSSKALLDIVPDRVIVWNETQKHEATDLHQISAERVLVTGAQCYDLWFGRRPSRSREEFCRSMNLASDRPFLLYVCSAMSPDPHEAAFVREWLTRVRASANPRLREAGILIRPHPERGREWTDVDLSKLSNVALDGRNPIDATAKAEYYDALFYSTAVIGLVTSAFLEAAIVGRPAYTLLLPAFQPHQTGMQHFDYLVRVEGGVLQTASSFDEHLQQLAAAIAGNHGRSEQMARFLRAFVRPEGLDVAATPRFVEAVEHVAAVTKPATVPIWVRLVQPVLHPVAPIATHRWLQRLWMDKVEIERAKIESANRVRKEKIIRARVAIERRIERDRQRRQHRKEWRKRLRVRPRKILAAVKGRVKQMIGADVR